MQNKRFFCRDGVMRQNIYFLNVKFLCEKKLKMMVMKVVSICDGVG